MSVRSDRLSGVRTRRGPALALSVILTVPVLAACSGSAEDDVRATAQSFLETWADADVAAAAEATSDPEATTALLEQTAADLPEATLSAELGKVTVQDEKATVAWTA